MGFSISASTALIFAALFLAFGTFYPAMANGYERVADASTVQSDQALDQAQTDLTLSDVIITDGGPPNQIQELTINVTNTGETTLTVNETDILIDGEYIRWTNDGQASADPITFEVDGNPETNLWLPNETATISYDEGGNFPTPSRFKIANEHGVSVSGDV